MCVYMYVYARKGRGVGTRERDAEDAEEQEGGGQDGGSRGAEEVGWPKVARVEYWNALPEAISVRCPPFALLSCPLQVSSSFPYFSLSLCLPSFLSALSFVSSLLSSLSLSFSPFLSILSPFTLLSRAIRGIFHLEPRRSLAINPRICRPTGIPIAPHRDIRTLAARSSASFRGTTSTIQTRRLSGMRRHSRSLVRGFSRQYPP